jgi:hypothetical protein
LKPFETVEIVATYIPSNQGSDSGTITISGNHAGSPTTIQLTGLGLRSNLNISPSTRAFGPIQINTTNFLNVTVSNTGNTNAAVYAVERFGSSRFFVTDPPLPFDVQPSQPVTVKIEYVPINIETVLIAGGTVKSSGNPTIVTP